MEDVNIVELSLTLMVWVVIVLLALKLYKKQEEKIKGWKIALLLLGGLFSFSIEIPVDGEIMRLAVLPLGVMILSLVFRKKKERWSLYRKYAWLGFWANYFFLAIGLLSNPIHGAIYPEGQPNTYLATYTKPSLMIIHPSGQERTIDQKEFEVAVQTMTLQEAFPSLDWYYEIEKFEPKEPKHVVERFPYIVNGIKPKWGSGIHSIVYLEKDGKGIMVSTPEGQYYYRTEHLLFKEGVQE